MKDLKIRAQRVADARRFFEMLSHPDFIYFTVKPKTLQDEKDFLRRNAKRRRDGTDFNFSIVWKGQLVGAVGIKIDQHRKYIGEIGYFIDRRCWGRGLAAAAVRLAERFAIRQLRVKRLEIITLKKNGASQRVAEKCRYRREGVQRGKILHDGKYQDAILYAKTVGGL